MRKSRQYFEGLDDDELVRIAREEDPASPYYDLLNLLADRMESLHENDGDPFAD